MNLSIILTRNIQVAEDKIQCRPLLVFQKKYVMVAKHLLTEKKLLEEDYSVYTRPVQAFLQLHRRMTNKTKM